MKNIYLNHRVVQLWGIDLEILDNQKKLIKIIDEIAFELGLKVLNSYLHRFKPQGLSLILIIAESHLAIHTWPEFNYLHIDILSCSKSSDLSKMKQILIEKLDPKKIYLKKINYSNFLYKLSPCHKPRGITS